MTNGERIRYRCWNYSIQEYVYVFGVIKKINFVEDVHEIDLDHPIKSMYSVKQFGILALEKELKKI